MRTWFVSGANRGLGLEIARAALEAGDQVVATARRPEQITERLEGFGDRLLPVALDVTDRLMIAQSVEAAKSRFGRIDILVNNAGYGQLGAFELVSEDAIERQFATNVFGVFAVTRAILPIMRAQRSGHVITIASIAGLIGFDGASIYCASKFALEGWSESLSLELAQFGIRTTVVEPGVFRTDFLDQSSVAHGDLEIADYTDYTAKRRAGLDKVNHQQAGNPAKLGSALVALAASANPPVRFGVGSDAYETIVNRASKHREEADLWRDLTRSTDF